MYTFDAMSPEPLQISSDQALSAGAKILAQHPIRHLPVVDLSGRLCGLLTDADVFRHGAFLDVDRGWIAHEPEWDSLSCGDVATATDAVARPTDPLVSALEQLGRTRSDALVVVDADRRPVGILTEVDVLSLACGCLDASIGADEKATEPVHGVDVAEPAGRALWVMLEEGIRHLLVTEHGRAKGVLSFRDLIREDVSRRPDLLVGEILGPGPLFSAEPGLSLLDAVVRMQAHKIGCLPIVDPRRLPLRIVTRRDVLRAVIAQLNAAKLFPETDPSLPQLVEEILITHAGVQRFLDRVEALGGARGEELASELGGLAGLLPHHFAHEEAPDGFFDRLTFWLPKLRGEVESLRQEHTLLLEQIGSLRAGGSAAEVRSFARLLADHEDRERRLSLLCEEAADD